MAPVDAFEFLKDQLRERQWSIPQLAKAARVSIGLAYKWVAEDPAYRVNPSPASCRKLAAGLGIDEDRMLEIAGHRTPRAGDDEAKPGENILELAEEMARTLEERGWPKAMWTTVARASMTLVQSAPTIPAWAAGQATSETPVITPGPTPVTRPTTAGTPPADGDDDQLQSISLALAA